MLLLYAACFPVKALREQSTALLIMGLGFLVKLLYVLNTSIYTRQHDMGYFNSEAEHASYIQYLLDNHSMPDFDPSTRWQYYHPPLHHAICALWIDLSENFFGVGYDQARESLQTLTLFYAMVIIITCYRILRHFHLKGTALQIPLIIVAFHPTFMILSSSMNNDALSAALIVGAIYCTLKWYESPTLKGILKIALCIGLGMMTKLSAAVIAIPIAIVFLVVLIKKLCAKQWHIFGHYAAFLVVCASLGLWNPIRNYIKFSLPLNYVQELSPSMLQYIGDESFWSRITDFSARQFSSVFVQFAQTDESGAAIGYNENNPLIAALKNFLFDEFINENIFADGTTAQSIVEIFFWVSVELAALALIATVAVCIIKCRMKPMQKGFLGISYLAMMVSFYALSAASTLCLLDELPVHYTGFDLRSRIPQHLYGSVWIA
ncbi:MAG: glycosyltransferase family 39 protein [Ruminococcus sp.]|nr:glycosyltransferase family 39 protein [Ruminococcus sp.]